MMESIFDFAGDYWRAAIEIAILSVVLYYAYLYFRGTRGAKVLTGLAISFLTLTLFSQLLQLVVISWLLRSLTAFLAIALVVIFQPELRRALAALGSHHIFTGAVQGRETLELVRQSVFELSNRQFGALIALERDTNLQVFAESGVQIDCDLSSELLLTIFQPRTPLHDGGLIIQNDRILAAACIFPVSQRDDLERNLGLRHRAAVGISEESDAIAIVVSEETGVVSICHRGRIERNFEPETFRRRLAQLLAVGFDEKTDSEQLGSEDSRAVSGDRPLVSHQKERRDDPLAF
jgi:diadenylate cyclase